MSVTITFAGKIDEVLFELRQLTAHHGLAAAGVFPVPHGAPIETPAVTGYPDEALYVERHDIPPTKPVEQRVAEAIASNAPVKRHRRTKAEMEAARAAAINRQEGGEEIAGGEPDPGPVADLAAEHAEAAYAGIEADVGEEADPTQTKPLSTETSAAASSDNAPPKPTFEDVKAVLRKILETDGLGVEAAREFMKPFGIVKVSELHEVEWPKFIAKANALIAGGAK